MKKNFCRSLILFILISLFLQACLISSPFGVSSTNTPSLTPTPLCPPVVLATPERLRFDSKLVVVLFEDTPQYHEYILDAINLVNGALNASVEPGDYLLMIRMEAPSLEDATLVRARVENILPPAVPLTPTPRPTLSPLPVITVGPGSILEAVATQTANAFETHAVATATYNAMEYQCAITDWQEQYLHVLDEWQQKKTSVVQDFMNDVVDQQSKISYREISSAPKVWEGLDYASLIMQNECINYSRCTLITFSALADTRKVPPANLEIDLGRTEFLGIMLNCEYLYTKKCGQWVEFWRNNINAKSVDFINGDNVSEKLIEFLRR